MSNNWETRELGEVCEYFNGKAHEQCIIEDGKYILINSKFISSDGTTYKRTNDALFPILKGDIAMVLSDVPNGKALAKCYLIDQDNTYSLNQRICVFRSNKFNTKFLYYQLNRNKYFLSFDNGENQTNLRLNQILSCPLVVPPIHEQERIVVILDDIYTAIAKAKKNAEMNLQNVRGIFESYSQRIFSIPKEGWEMKKVREVCEYDKTPNKESDLPYVGLENIESNSGRFIGSLEPQKVKSLTFHFTHEHVLYGRLRPYLNKVLLPTFKGHCSTEIFPIKPNKYLDRGFLFRWLLFNETVKKIDSTWTGARMPRANMNTVLEFEIPIPSVEEQKSIVKKLDALSSETKKLEAIYKQKLANLEELKKSVLQKAFNGELAGAHV